MVRQLNTLCDPVISVAERDDGRMSAKRDPSGRKSVFLLAIFSFILSQILPTSRGGFPGATNQMLKDPELGGIPPVPRRLLMRFERAGLEMANYHKSSQPLMPWTKPWRRI